MKRHLFDYKCDCHYYFKRDFSSLFSYSGVCSVIVCIRFIKREYNGGWINWEYNGGWIDS